MRFSKNYEAGQILDVTRHRAPGGIARGSYEVTKVDKSGRVSLKDEKGKTHYLRPEMISPRDKRDALKLYEKEKTKLHEGDKIRWTANDKDRKLDNSALARVVAVTQDGISVETQKGEVIDLKPGDKMLERLGLAYAINTSQAQGMTKTDGIGVMHSAERNLSNQRLAHVMMTRVRESITIITNDADRLLKTIMQNPGDKPSALEATGEVDLRKEALDRRTATDLQNRLGTPSQAPAGPHGGAAPATPAKTKGAPQNSPQTPIPQRPAPERSRDLSL